MKSSGLIVIVAVVVAVLVAAMAQSSGFRAAASDSSYVGPDVYSGGQLVVTTATVQGSVVTTTTVVNQVVVQPAQTGIVPRLVLQDSYGVNHTLASSAVPLSVAGAPTIPASRGKLYLSLQGYFEVDEALIEKYGVLTRWTISGQVTPIVCQTFGGTCAGVSSLQFSAEGQGVPTDSFSIYVTNQGIFPVSSIISTLDMSKLRNGIYRLGMVHDRVALQMYFASGDSSGSRIERSSFSSLNFEYRDGQIIFFDSAEINRATSVGIGLSIIDAWLPDASKVRF
ncbi:MAG: hypothetical protein HYY22_07865 [Thaumarchaeota archaeon]|nr:hypothetical protein [Nitrososphaerota archaeon]